MSTLANPTKEAYSSLNDAYEFFNSELFDGRLPNCLITVQRHKGLLGYFSGDRFASVTDPKAKTDEIALNPTHFASRSVVDTLSTLVHEMTHLEQHHYGKPSRNGYHNKEWVGMMERVGLIPYSIADPEKQTGQKVTHRIEPGGRFADAYKRYLEAGGAVSLYHDRAGCEDKEKKEKKRSSKTKYTCPDCDANAWAKPESNLKCGDCDKAMIPDNPEEGDED